MKEKVMPFSGKDLQKMIIPLFLEQLLMMLVVIADTLIVSYAGEAAVSGVSLVNQFNTIFIYLFTALASGGAVVISQYIGRKDSESAGKPVIFLYGMSAEIRMQLQAESEWPLSIKGCEVAFHRYNFPHLTGVKMNSARVASAIHFFEKCLDNRLIQEDFDFAKDGSTVQKLDILENMMEIKRNATMMGAFTDRGYST